MVLNIDIPAVLHKCESLNGVCYGADANNKASCKQLIGQCNFE